MTPPTFLLVAGEASADFIGGGLIEALARRIPGARFVGMGGPRMRAAGLQPLYDANEINVMGFVEVLPKVRRILQVMGGLAEWAVANRPQAAILLDAPDFNLRLADRLRERGIPVVYYVAPMAWAWREGRVRALRQRVDRLLCIYPFEEPFFRRRAVPARFVGSPLLEDPQLQAAEDRAFCRASIGLPADGRVVGLLPGSRQAEIDRVLPTLLAAADRLLQQRPHTQFVLPVAPSLERSFIEGHLAGHQVRPLLCESALQALGAADAAAVCSGTATLQAALLRTPTVVVYRTSPSSWQLVQWLVDLDHASIVNILAGREVLPELLQEAFTPAATAERLLTLLEDGPTRESMAADLAAVRRDLGADGPGASERAADEVLQVAGLARADEAATTLQPPHLPPTTAGV